MMMMMVTIPPTPSEAKPATLPSSALQTLACTTTLSFSPHFSVHETLLNLFLLDAHSGTELLQAVLFMDEEAWEISD